MAYPEDFLVSQDGSGHSLRPTEQVFVCKLIEAIRSRKREQQHGTAHIRRRR
jgi:hypothetical protein